MGLQPSQHASKTAFLAVLSIVSLAYWAFARSPDAGQPLPETLLWAWERPEDLSFLNGQDVGVVVLTGTILLRGDQVQVHPRMQPAIVPEGIFAFPVVRIETNLTERPTLDEAQRATVVEAILALTRGRAAPVVQVDFDAVVSERPFYRELVRDLRKELPTETKLSMTALASWCLGDPWIADLPVDEAVPMLFAMGPDGVEVERLMANGSDFSIPICRISLGVSTGEPTSRPNGRRTYIFHSRAWTAEALEGGSWR